MTSDASIIIPAHNAAATLGRCLDGIAGQTDCPGEIIVVDDRSTDATADVARQHGARCVANTGQQGPAGARNFGAWQAGGKILVFIDSDCIPPEDWLENILKPFASADVGAVGGGYCGGADDSFWQCFSHLELVWRRKNRDGETCSLVSNNMACCADLFHKHGGFPEQYPVCEDMYLSYRISQDSRVLWLDGNGVVHNFTTSLPGFLRHQFRFAVESLRFFGDNPDIMASDHHQGKQLHKAILAAGSCLWLGVFAIVLLLSGASTTGRLAMAGSVATGTLHWLLYRPFIKWLKKRDFSSRRKAYLCSWVRDAVCFHAALPGGLCWLRSKL